MKIPELSYNPIWTTILIIGTYLTGILIGNYVLRFRFSEYRWIYQYGSYLNSIMVFGSLCWSLFHPLIVWSNKKSEWKKYLIYTMVGFIPLIHFISKMIIAENSFGNKIID